MLFNKSQRRIIPKPLSIKKDLTKSYVHFKRYQTPTGIVNIGRWRNLKNFIKEKKILQLEKIEF